jgi:hypothetical protein
VSFSQSKNGLMTTERGVYGAESSSLTESGSPNRYENNASFHSTAPSIAFAYGSRRSLLGLHRSPAAGSYGPCTR